MECLHNHLLLLCQAELCFMLKARYLNWLMCVCACMQVCVKACAVMQYSVYGLYMHVCMCACVYVCTCVCVYVCTCVCVCVCVCFSHIMHTSTWAMQSLMNWLSYTVVYRIIQIGLLVLSIWKFVLLSMVHVQIAFSECVPCCVNTSCVLCMLLVCECNVCVCVCARART